MDPSLQDDLLVWLTTEGFPTTGQLTALRRGLGSNELWRLDQGGGAPALVVRVFGRGEDANARREQAAMAAARAGDIPAPEVVAAGLVGDRPVLATTFMPGIIAAERLLGHPASATALGTALGTTLGRLHLLPAPSDPGRAAGAWLDLGGEAVAPLRPVLAALPHQDRLLHLDYHPRNVLVESDVVSGVIDWENTHAGPPHADVGRSLAILRVLMLADLVPSAMGPAIDAFGVALETAHDRIAGPSPAPAALKAWGLAMTAADLRRQAGKPGSPITPPVLARLEAERDAAIAATLDDHG
jgi:aminoglycoside phosphotransferase (APT) family kinase protein